MPHLRTLLSVCPLVIAAGLLLGSGQSWNAGLFPGWPSFVATAHALGPIVGYSRLPADEPPEPRLPVDAQAVERWYEHEVAKEQARGEFNLERIELRFPERWPGERDDPHGAYQRARKQEQLRSERALRELDREYRQKFR